MDTKELVRPVAQAILDSAAEAEAGRRLPDHLMAKLRAQGLFSIYTPREFGGIGLPLPEALEVVEEVSRHDGSTGWTVALGIGNNFFLSGLPTESVARILAGGSALMAGAPGPQVRAEPVDGGYRLTGQWPFNSGAWNADWVGVAAPIWDGAGPRMGAFGPEMVFAVLPIESVEVIDTWQVTGLRATSTHDMRVHELFVPGEMAGAFGFPKGPRPVREGPLNRFALFTILGLAQSPPVCLGIGRHAVDEFRGIALGKELPFGGRLSERVQAQAALARAEALVRSARTYWYDAVRKAWDRVSSGAEATMEDAASLKLASLLAVENCVAATDIVYRQGGSTSIFQSSVIERCWRDVHTAAQHVSVQDGRWETAGRVLFGMEPGSLFI